MHGKLSRRLICDLSLAVLISLRAASPCLACINDTYSDRAESEFRSRYDQPPAPPRSAWADYYPSGVAALSAGAGLIAGALAVNLRRRKREGE